MRTRQGYSGNAWADEIDREREAECEECGGIDHHFDGCSVGGREEMAADEECDRRRERAQEEEEKE